MIDVKNLVFIHKDEYEELISKAAIYDAFARKIKADADRGGYISEYEQAMFVVPPKEVTNAEVMESLGLKYEDEEEVVAIFTEEEWEEKVVPLAEEEEIKEED